MNKNIPYRANRDRPRKPKPLARGRASFCRRQGGPPADLKSRQEAHHGLRQRTSLSGVVPNAVLPTLAVVVEQKMQLHPALGAGVLGPGAQAQAQGDHGGVEADELVAESKVPPTAAAVGSCSQAERSTYADLSDAKTSDVSIARTLDLLVGSIVVVVDRGYVDYALWGRWTRDDQLFFVTRLKTNVPYRVIETRAIAPRKSDTVLLDQVIQLASDTARSFCPYRLRRVVVRDSRTGQDVVLLTNHEGLAAHTVGRIYRERWQIELFFKALKQNLKVKTLLGTSENALAVQLWTALIGMLLVKYLQWRSQ